MLVAQAQVIAVAVLGMFGIAVIGTVQPFAVDVDAGRRVAFAPPDLGPAQGLTRLAGTADKDALEPARRLERERRRSPRDRGRLGRGGGLYTGHGH
jgi:hypothetical protein